MNFSILAPRHALTKAYPKLTHNRNEIEKFKTNLAQLLNHINEIESEEFHKNIISFF